MSKQNGDIVPFKHTYDCRQEGCPGHTIQVVLDRSMDNMLVKVDGSTHALFDENAWDAMLTSFPGKSGN